MLIANQYEQYINIVDGYFDWLSALIVSLSGNRYEHFVDKIVEIYLVNQQFRFAIEQNQYFLDKKLLVLLQLHDYQKVKPKLTSQLESMARTLNKQELAELVERIDISHDQSLSIDDATLCQIANLDSFGAVRLRNVIYDKSQNKNDIFLQLSFFLSCIKTDNFALIQKILVPKTLQFLGKDTLKIIKSQPSVKMFQYFLRILPNFIITMLQSQGALMLIKNICQMNQTKIVFLIENGLLIGACQWLQKFFVLQCILRTKYKVLQLQIVNDLIQDSFVDDVTLIKRWEKETKAKVYKTIGIVFKALRGQMNKIMFYKFVIQSFNVGKMLAVDELDEMRKFISINFCQEPTTLLDILKYGNLGKVLEYQDKLCDMSLQEDEKYAIIRTMLEKGFFLFLSKQNRDKVKRTKFYDSLLEDVVQSWIHKQPIVLNEAYQHFIEERFNTIDYGKSYY